VNRVDPVHVDQHDIRVLLEALQLGVPYHRARYGGVPHVLPEQEARRLRAGRDVDHAGDREATDQDLDRLAWPMQASLRIGCLRRRHDQERVLDVHRGPALVGSHLDQL
jgi:hypothetical protein